MNNKDYQFIIAGEDGEVKLTDTISGVVKKAIKSDSYKGFRKRIRENKVINREFGFRSFIIDKFWLDVLGNKEVKPFDLRLLIYLIGSMDFDNFCFSTQTEIAKFFGSERSNISAALKKLSKLGYISIHKENGVVHRMYYRVSPLIAYKGKYEDWKKEIFESNEVLLMETEMNDYYGE